MALPELTDNLNVIQSLPDKPAKTALELKQDFDKGSNTIKTYINETLLPQLNTIITNLQNGSTSVNQAITSLQTTVNGLSTTIAGLKSGATTKITIGSSVPETLENGEVYFQYFN
jgi:hypothetical protein